MSKQEELASLILSNNLVAESDLAEAAQEAGVKNISLESILIKKNLLDLEELYKLKANVENLPYQNLLEKDIPERVLHIIPSEVAQNYKIICFERKGDIMKVGMVEPNNFKAVEAVDFLAKEAGLKAQYFLISPKSFKETFDKYKSLDDELSSALKTKAAEEEIVTTKESEKSELEDITKSAPVAKIVSVIIRHAIDGGASDIHIEPMTRESRVRYRIDGILHTSLVLPRNVHDAIVARVKVLANLKLDETRVPQDGRIRLVHNDNEIDFRISILPLVGAEKVVMRILDVTKGAPSLKDLGFIGRQYEIIAKNIKKSDGLMLVTGPTGSGKSTTLFSLIDMLNQEGVNISTLEDPVEYQIKGVNQSQIRPEVGYTFATGLRSLLRQDPDVVMVGEIRDDETAELAIHSALTGHYVLSTLHTIDAPGAITRLIDMKVEPFLLGSTLNMVVAQRLARKICSHCRKEAEMPAEYQALIKKEIENIEKISKGYISKIKKDYNPNKLKFYKGAGCSACGNTGYRGRIAITEILDITDYLKEAIINGKRHLSVQEIAADQEFFTMYQDGIIKILKGEITMEELLRIMQT